MGPLRGVGVYARDLGHRTHGTPKQTARKAADHHLSFVPMLCLWQEMRQDQYRQRAINSPAEIARYAEALLDVGVKPGVWFYPWGGHEEELLAHLEVVLRVCAGMIKVLVPDPELGYKWKRARGAQRPVAAAGSNMRGPDNQGEAIPGRGAGGEVERTEQARKLMGGLVDMMDEDMDLIVTSYGIARYHPNFPWEVFLDYGILSGQLYGADRRTAAIGMEEWRTRAGDPEGERSYLPSVATYGPTAQWRLGATLSAFDNQDIDGMLAWSWPQTDAHEWRVLAERAERWE